MVGITDLSRAHRTVAEVEAAWERWLAKNPPLVRQRAGDTSRELRTTKRRLVCHISAGRWVAQCPCGGGVPGWPFHERGACLDCGTIWKLDYPSREEIVEIVKLLRVRPGQQRNFRPDLGEDVDLLRRENAVYRFDHDQADSRIVRASIGDLRSLLSKKAFGELERAGLLGELPD